jgi:hypothetical protein
MFANDLYDVGQTALDRTKDVEEAIRKLNRRIDRLNEVVIDLQKYQTKELAKRECEKMMKERENYIPPRKTSAKCDFTIIGDEVICSRCHNSIDTLGFIPSYCPFCFAKREV